MLSQLVHNHCHFCRLPVMNTVCVHLCGRKIDYKMCSSELMFSSVSFWLFVPSSGEIVFFNLHAEILHTLGDDCSGATLAVCRYNHLFRELETDAASALRNS